MNDVLRNECCNVAAKAVESADIKITLEPWPCVVAVLGICATYAYVSWLNHPSRVKEA